jgi:hypothetical protein
VSRSPGSKSNHPPPLEVAARNDRVDRLRTGELIEPRDPQPSIPDAALDELRDFLRSHIGSHEQLEVLLFMARNRRKAWTPDQVGVATRLPQIVAASALDQLHRRALLDEIWAAGSAKYAYFPSSPALAAWVDQVVSMHDDDLSLIRLMNDNALSRVRASAATLFADAFNVWKRKT